MSDHDATRRAYLEVVPVSDGGFKSALSNALHEELTEALARRADAGHKTAFAAIRAEIHRRNGEGGVECRIPAFADYCAEVTARRAIFDNEHATYAAAPAYRQAYMRANGYVPLSTSQPMPKAPTKALVKPNKPIDLDVIEAGQIGNSFRFDPAAHGKRAVAMIAQVEGLKKERAIKATLAGIYLHGVRLALDHGEWEAWAAKHLGKSVRTARNYMSLAAAFSRKSKLLLPEMVGANQLTLDLQAQDSDGRAILAKLDKFVGGEGLTALMQKHGVLSAPAPKSPIANTPAGDRETAHAEKTDEEKHAEAIDTLRRSALDTLTAFNEIRDRWQLLSDDQLRVTLGDIRTLGKVIHGWLETPKARRAAFDPAPYLDGTAEKEVLARRHEGTAFASLAA